VQASNVKEFKINGNAELHNVSIVLYGRDSSRFDQIYGDDFAFNQKTGDVTAKGDVQIDLVANPAGLESPDQSTPRELRNPIHLKTRDLVFNKDSGNAWTDARVEFRTPQASGWAVGVKYAGKTNTLTLASEIHIVLTGPEPVVIDAKRGVITNDPRQIALEAPQLTRPGGTVRAEQATFYLGPQNHVERVLAKGEVSTETLSENGTNPGQQLAKIHGRADEAEFLLPGGQDLLRTATLTGNVKFEELGAQDIKGDAGRVIFDFGGQNRLQKVHAHDGAHLFQKMTNGAVQKGSAPQDFDLLAPTIDFVVVKGHLLRQATTSGDARMMITQAQPPGTEPAKNQPTQQTVVTARKFVADFTNSDGKSHLAAIHGTPDVRIANSVQGQPDRVSTSDSVEAAFFPQGGISSIMQKGNVVYSDNQPAEKRLQAWASSGRYTPADHILLLSGSPRVTNGGMATTANTIRINRATGDVVAAGDVKSTYSELKEQPDGALLAASSPIHVTSGNMTAHNSPALATYTGHARLWQDANIIEAPSIQFDRDRRSVTAEGTSSNPAQTVLVQLEKEPAGTPEKPKTGVSASRSSPISITAKKLSYVDADRKVHYEGGVLAKATDFTASSRTADAYLLPRNEGINGTAASGPGRLDRMVAQGDVAIQQSNRQARGETLTYTSAEDKFVLTGGPPSIFDAEQGKITGVSLTFFRRDDRVLVEGKASTPVVTTTRVAR